MNLITRNPSKFVWLSIPFILALSFLGVGNNIDIQMHDTYFVFDTFQIGIMLSVILALIGMLYWLVEDKETIKWMVIAHVTITILAFIILVLTSMSFTWLIQMDTSFFGIGGNIFLMALLAALGSQLIFMINLVQSLLQNREEEEL